MILYSQRIARAQSVSFVRVCGHLLSRTFYFASTYSGEVCTTLMTMRGLKELHTAQSIWQAAWSRLEEVRAREHCHEILISCTRFRYKITNNYGNAASIIDENCCQIAPKYVVFNDRHDEGDLNTYIRFSGRECAYYSGRASARGHHNRWDENVNHVFFHYSFFP